MDIAQSRPRLRTDLLAKPTDQAGGRYIVDVTDPSSGQSFQFYDVEYHLATAMNGERDLAALAAWASAELGLRPSEDELTSVIDKLGELGYLDTAPAEIPAAPELGQYTAAPTPSRSAAAAAAADLMLGLAGGTEQPDDGSMPAPADLELGLAGNETFDIDSRATYVAPDLSLGRAGGSSGFPGEDEDDLPTSIKDPRHPEPRRLSDPAIPPRPPTGQEPTPSLQPVTRGSDDDGPTQLPPPATDFDEDEMSVDLTDHMKLGPEAVKEAVRQSQMLQAVSPDELLETPEAPGAAEAPEKPAAGAGKAAADAGKATKGADQLEPTELPPHRPPVSKPIDVDDRDRPMLTSDETPSSSRTGLVILVLVLVLVAAAAAVYFLNLFDVRTRLGLDGDKAAQGSTDTPKTTVTPKTEKPAKIELPSAKLEEQPGEPVVITAPQSGVLVSITESGTEVEEGAEIARFRGGEAFEREITNTSQRLEHYQSKLTKAQASGVAGEIDRAQKKVDEKVAAIDDAKQKLEAFIVRSPQAGAFRTELSADAKVEQDQVLGAFAGSPVLVATFEVPEGKTLNQGDEVEVASKADEKKRAGCQVASVSGQSVTVECPSQEGLGAGDDVVLP